MSKTPRTDAAWKTCVELEARTPLRDLCAEMEVALNDAKEALDEANFEIKSLNETIRDQEDHISELQSMRRYTPGYTAEP